MLKRATEQLKRLNLNLWMSKIASHEAAAC